MVFCFGELLLRMSPALDRRWIHEAKMPVYIGGAELNVAIALSRWNVPVRYVTALPTNDLSTDIVTEIQEKKIDTSSIVFSGSRVGLYFLPQGGDLKSAGVIYDRAGSSFSELKPGIINWEKVLEGCSWFHFSAISPALNRNVADVCLEGLQFAQSIGMKISVDLNYRQKLWQYGVKPVDVMPDLTSYCNVVMGNLWAAESLLGIESPIKESKGVNKERLISAAGESMLEIHRRFPKVNTMAFTYRLEKDYWAVIQHGNEMAISRQFAIENVTDRVGSGDCFMGGLIYGLHSGKHPKEVIDYAAAAAVGKLHEKGDSTNRNIDSVISFLNDNGKE